MEEHKLDTRLEQLLITKIFVQLTPEEKSYVLSFLSEEKYQEYAFVLSASKKALSSNYDSLQPSPKTLQKLQQIFADKAIEKKQYNTVFVRPLYQSLAAAILLLIVISLVINLHFGAGRQKLAARKTSAYHIKKEPIIAQAKSPYIAVSKPIARLKTVNKHQPAYKSGKILAVTEKKHDRNLCMDIRVAPTYLMIADTVKANTPCLDTRVPIPEINTDPDNIGGR